MARVGLVSLLLLVFTTPLAAGECTRYRAAIDAESAAFAAYQSARDTDSFAASVEVLRNARDVRQLAMEAVDHVPDEKTRAASFAALEAARGLARAHIERKGEDAIVAAEDAQAYMSRNYYEAVFTAACK